MVSFTTQSIVESPLLSGLPAFFQTGSPVIEGCLEETYNNSGNALAEPATMDLPAFFQTGSPVIEECLEDTLDTESGVFNLPYSNISRGLQRPHIDERPVPDDEKPTNELLDFFHGVRYEDMEEMFWSFEFGNTWMSNPIFTDEFARVLPKALSDIVYELHSILLIQRVLPLNWNRIDTRYTSLSVPEQTRLRELIHETPTQRVRLVNLYNRLNEFQYRTPYPQLKFLIGKTMNVVQDILRKEIQV